MNQSSTPISFTEIPSYDGKDYRSGNVVQRFVDGLGYRYYWVTEGLTADDLRYKPSDDSRTTFETIRHLYGLSETILNAAKNEANIRPQNFDSLSFEQLRSGTLANLQQASALYENKTEKDISELKVIFEFNGNRTEFPFWNMMNGPISDAIYHTGQVVSYRRASGNPINPKVNVFMGTDPMAVE